MKKRNILLLLVLCLSLGVMAQERNRNPHSGRIFNRERFEQRKQGFIIERAELNADEARYFLSVYEEMRQAQRKVHKEMFRLKRKGGELDGKEAEKAVQRLIKLQREADDIQADAYKEMLKKLPPEKVLRCITAEDEFHRNMVRDIPKRKFR